MSIKKEDKKIIDNPKIEITGENKKYNRIIKIIPRKK